MRLMVNGLPHELDIEPRTSLADLLRDRLGLTGTHLGCEQGVCGACTVLVDDLPLRSCLMLAVQAEGHRVTTVEGLRDHPRLAHVPQAFLRHRAFQCGFCTPGFEMVTAGMVLGDERPRGAHLRERLSSNLCRCTGYQAIVDAVDEALG